MENNENSNRIFSKTWFPRENVKIQIWYMKQVLYVGIGLHSVKFNFLFCRTVLFVMQTLLHNKLFFKALVGMPDLQSNASFLPLQKASKICKF